ncbi:4-alpha-glucanotransferase [Veronia nyctiphanis]|uniref:4-alpha-glucanotransferase n=1 Tax=Veronia nyctiphanis TaxID=1278244 RepID=A0A4V1LTA3_9GAMM|nr:4-alpha-glucanotransferase [Veronia nyctiphanis]RXJ74498.1 4-alpha-glucanotransferase [Veronia nyctiphanis]
MNSTISQIAHEAGIAAEYIDAWGKGAVVDSKIQEALLTALGYDLSSEKALIKSAERKSQKDILSPVSVFKQTQQKHIHVNVSKSARLSEFSWRLDTECGQKLFGELSTLVASDTRVDGGELIISLPESLPVGYHQFSLTRKRRKSPITMTLIVAPEQCFKSAALREEQKLWGPSAQLYTLRSESNWGIGDFSDLRLLVSEVAKQGGDFVGINPIHALFPATPESASPYSPSSRSWLNVLYIDVAAVPEFNACKEAQEFVSDESFQQQLKTVRNSEYVDYTGVASLKFPVLRLLFTAFKSLKADSSRALQFSDFIREGGESLYRQATFDALHTHLNQDVSASELRDGVKEAVWGWPVFPEKYQHFSKSAVKQFATENADHVEFFMFLQWTAKQQLESVQAEAMDSGMKLGLYRDLAVGVCNSGSETWADEGDLVLDASIGAPPDVLGPLGQNWGLPPFNPDSMRNNAYKPFIELLRANMQHCGALRIDHILGLLRLWWVPKGRSACDGAYIYNKVNDLLSILALESHRFKCSVIGEDLGTVPDEIVLLLNDAGIYSYKVLFFEVAEDGGYFSPSHYAPQSMATLCTHDMPTLKGFWHCEDLKLGEKLGLYTDPEEIDALYRGRAENKQRLLDSLRWHGVLSDGIGHDAAYVPMDSYLNHAMHLHLASGTSALLSIQLEDWLEMDNPVNVPGTSTEYPNWRRKLSASLEEIFSKPDIKELAQQLTRKRTAASGTES